MNVLDLFSGIGGFSLGLERAGMRTVAFCEIDPYCRAVLRKHWPGVPIFGDVRELRADQLPAIDLICGGFPCQDISVAGRGAGIDGERSGLWREFARLLSELRPSYAIVENVAALTFRGLLRILGDLAEIGFDAEWHCIPACAVGAPHERDRVWIVAYANGRELRQQPWRRRRPSGTDSVLAADDGTTWLAAYAPRVLRAPFFWEQSDRALQRHWPRAYDEELEALRGMDDGVSGRVDGLAALGNAVVSQIPEIIGRAILEQH